MTASIVRLTPYESRLKLVEDALLAHSRLDADSASELAVHVLAAIASIPEKIR